MRKALTIGLVLCIAMSIGVISVCAQGPELTAEQPQDLVARGDNYTVKGTATGVDIVDIAFRGPGEFRGYSFEHYYLFYSGFAAGNSFEKDIHIPEDAYIGNYVVAVLSPGTDGVYGTTTHGEGELMDAILDEHGIGIGDLEAKSQDEFLKIIGDATVNKPSSDDLMVTLSFSVELVPQGAIRGDVYDAETGSSVEGATVICKEFWMTEPEVWVPAPGAPETTTTDTRGHFEFKDISIGASGRKCEITVEHVYYETESRIVYLSDLEPQSYLRFELPMTPPPTVTPTSTPTPTAPPVTPTPPPTATPIHTATPAPTGEPELSISQSSLKEEPEVGEEVLITIAILNKGKATAKNIHLEERIPSSISVNYVEGADKAGGLVYWNGELEPGESHSITHTLRILEEKSRAIPVTVTYEDASGKTKQKSTEIYLTAEPVQEVTPTPSPLANIPWPYIIILVAVILVGLAIIVAVRRGGEGGGAEVTIEESK